MAQQVLSLQLGACLSMPTRASRELLKQLAKDCNKIRNAVATQWILQRRADPNWQPGARLDRKGNIKKDLAGNVLSEHPVGSQKMIAALYHEYERIAPHIGSNIASGCWSDVIKWLKGKVPWNSDDIESKFRWEAILKNEISLPTFKGCAIPVMNKDTMLGYRGMVRVKKKKDETPIKVVPTALSRMARDHCVLLTTIWSKKSGRKHKDIIFRLEVRQLTRGQRDIISRVASGEFRLADSKLIGKDGKWFYQLTYERPRQEKRNEENEAVLRPCSANALNPFVLEFRGRKRYLGHGETYRLALHRIGSRRRTIQARYREGSASGKGRKRFMRAYKSSSRAVVDMQKTVQRKLIAAVVRYCDKHDIGKLVYREPTMPLRDRTWFTRHDLPWAWAEMEAQLRFKLEPETKLVKQRIPVSEYMQIDDSRATKPKKEVMRYARVQCDNCQADVYLTVDKYLERNGDPTYCESCGRYVTQGTARKVEGVVETEVATRSMRRKPYRPRKNQQPLAKHRVTRKLPRGKDGGVAEN